MFCQSLSCLVSHVPVWTLNTEVLRAIIIVPVNTGLQDKKYVIGAKFHSASFVEEGNNKDNIRHQLSKLLTLSGVLPKLQFYYKFPFLLLWLHWNSTWKHKEENVMLKDLTFGSIFIIIITVRYTFKCILCLTSLLLKELYMLLMYFISNKACVRVWLSPPQLRQVLRSGWSQKCGSSQRQVRCQCRPPSRRRCRPGRRSAGCPCWGSRRTWRTGRTDAPRPGSPDHSLLPPARRDTWWILGVQEGRMDRRIVQEQERKKERQTEPSCRALLAGSRKIHSEHAQSAHEGGCYEDRTSVWTLWTPPLKLTH